MPEETKNKNGFDDPYGALEAKEKTRTTIDVSSAMRADISAVYPKKGVLQTTINLLLEKIRNELKRTNLTSYAPEQYEYAISHCQILFGGYEYILAPDGTARLVLEGCPEPSTPADSGDVLCRTAPRRVARSKRSGKSTKADSSDDR